MSAWLLLNLPEPLPYFPSNPCSDGSMIWLNKKKNQLLTCETPAVHNIMSTRADRPCICPMVARIMSIPKVKGLTVQHNPGGFYCKKDLNTLLNLDVRTCPVTHTWETEDLFVTPQPRGSLQRTVRTLFTDVIKFASPRFRELLERYLAVAVTSLGPLTGSDNYSYLRSLVCVSIIRYKRHKLSGLHLHTDNVTGGTGPIVTIAVGASVHYDMRPIIFTKEQLLQRHAFRFQVSPGTVIVLDSEVRYQWQHGIPYRYTGKTSKCTVKFTFPHFGTWTGFFTPI
jgi:hypothetical protein